MVSAALTQLSTSATKSDADVAFARIALFGIAGEEAAGQHLDSGFLPQVARKCQVVAVGNFQPNVERRVRQFDIKRLLQNRDDAVEFFLVEAAVVNNVFFIVPSGNAGALDGNTHRAAVVGAVEQEVF